MSPEIRKQAIRSVTEAYEAAWSEAKKHGDAAFAVLQSQDVLTSDVARHNFQEEAAVALVSAQQWVEAANACLDVLAELDTGYVRPRAPIAQR